jgi:hypothetical protein
LLFVVSSLMTRCIAYATFWVTHMDDRCACRVCLFAVPRLRDRLAWFCAFNSKHSVSIPRLPALYSFSLLIPACSDVPLGLADGALVRAALDALRWTVLNACYSATRRGSYRPSCMHCRFHYLRTLLAGYRLARTSYRHAVLLRRNAFTLSSLPAPLHFTPGKPFWRTWFVRLFHHFSERLGRDVAT